MAKKLYKYDGAVNKFVWFTTWNYALRNFYVDDVNHVPNPTIGNDFNTNVNFSSREPGMATVDWGDGQVEQFPLVKVRGSNEYKIIFRSLNIEYRKGPTNTWFWKEDGNKYIPVPPHHYDDDRRDIQRAVSIDFTCDIYKAHIDTCKMTDFPVVDIPGIETLIVSHTMWADSIPVDRLARATKLRELTLSNVGARINGFPDSIASKTGLVKLEMYNNFDFSDIDNCGIRNIKNLVNLENLNVSSCIIQTYIKEYNDLPKLSYLNMTPGPSLSADQVNPTPYFEVDKINPVIDNLVTLNDWMAGENRTEWPYHMSGKGLENLTRMEFQHANRLRMDVLPDFIYEMRSMTSLSGSSSFYTVERIDQFVNTFYDKVTTWGMSTMSSVAGDGLRNQFYGLSVEVYSSTYPTENRRPTGVEQAPEGFVKGVSNGSPQTPMERIYVLKNNYNQRWSINPNS